MKRDDDDLGSGAGHRHARLEGLIFEELRSLLRDDISDPTLLSGVAIVAITLSVDYRHARVHFAIRGDARRADVERAFVRATPFLRARLAEAIDMKRVPELRFVFDARAASGDNEGGAS
jgi:ribosome-binding factor A